ncbi:hypothetical protein BDQ17DRAFT_1522847 [Cyathus striatus]|nr:hypothetical protein BDQ17DRAFT_1522847 [Cyathus striatus]
MSLAFSLKRFKEEQETLKWNGVDASHARRDRTVVRQRWDQEKVEIHVEKLLTVEQQEEEEDNELPPPFWTLNCTIFPNVPYKLFFFSLVLIKDGDNACNLIAVCWLDFSSCSGLAAYIHWLHYCPHFRRHHGSQPPLLLFFEQQLHNTPYVKKFGKKAGRVVSTNNTTQNDEYHAKVGNEKNYYHPFISKLERDIAKWAKLQGRSSNAFDQLIQIDRVIDKLGLSIHSSSELNQRIDDNLPGCPHFVRKEISLLGDPNFAPYLVFEPEKHYTDDRRWWWEKQKQLEVKTPGSTIVPIIISTDKMQLTLF